MVPKDMVRGWGEAIMGIKELKPRRKYEKEIAKWPPFFMCEY